MKKIKNKKDWCVVHWLGKEVKMLGSKKECEKWAKRNSFNPKAPIYYAYPVAGVQLIIHKHEIIHIEKIGKTKKISK